MGYMHINNLYKDARIMNFKECFALEKVHGTSAHIAWNAETKEIRFFSGGEKHDKFVLLFDHAYLKTLFSQKFPDKNITFFGEAYGGKQQGMSGTYGKELCFIVFDVKINDSWLNTPNAESIVIDFGLEFVPYEKCSTSIEELDKQRDLDSVVAVRRGIKEPKIREGVVLRPLEEMIDSRGNRVITKHKRHEFMETKTPRKVDFKKLKLLEEARAIAEEWVTPMRLSHVLDKLGNPKEIEAIRDVIKAMHEDVYREGEGEVVDNKDSRVAIAKETVKLYKQHLNKRYE